MLMDVHQRGDLRFPKSLTEFQRLFPDDAACAGYLEKARWSDGFVCPHCQAAGEPFRFANRPGVLRCRKCRRDTGLTVGTVMARSHTPLSVWFWSAYLVSGQPLRHRPVWRYAGHGAGVRGGIDPGRSSECQARRRLVSFTAGVPQ
jgi:Transposase zinc-ribbon domain